jgi:NAD(P)-dependent dehydrogenase (short-subunit alcohol dehydrogenase family)
VEDFEGKIAVVTGAASGIGAALAAAFTKAGGSVVLADVEQRALSATADALAATGAAVEAVLTDVSDPASVEALAKASLARFGRVDILCNNAGVSTFNTIENQTPMIGVGSSTSTSGAWCTGCTPSCRSCRRREHQRTSSTPRRSPVC